MKLAPPFQRRTGHSLIELVAATACSVILLAGLGGVVFIARQIAYTPTASSSQVEAAVAVNRMLDELRHASWIVERTGNAIEFVVADRTGDDDAERIRYEWSGTPGDPLERTLNDGDPVVIVDGIESFEWEYSVDAVVEELTPLSDNSEAILFSFTTSNTNNERQIYYNTSDSTDAFVSQQINASALSPPAGAVAWNATRINFCGRTSGSATETLLVQLRSFGNPNNGPTSEVLGAVSVAESTLSGSSPPNNWQSTPLSFSSTIRGLSLTNRYSLVWASANTTAAARLHYNDVANSGSGVLESTDHGASWQQLPARQVFYRLYGTYTVAGTPFDVTRNYVSGATVALQIDDAEHSRIDASVPLANRPETVSAVWRADFEDPQPNPTAVDVAGDNTDDWVHSSGASFNANSVDEGIWTVNAALETRPANDFTSVTCIDARCHNGAALRINADRQGGTFGPVIVRLATSSGTQTLSLIGETAANTERVLTTVERLPDQAIRFQLVIVPQKNTVHLTVDGREIGSYVYPTYNTSTSNRYITLSGNGAKFDFVEARVLADAAVE